MSATTIDHADAADRADLHRKMDAEIANLVAQTAKLTAETSKLLAEQRSCPWLPLITATIGSTGLIGSIVALIIAFHR